MAIFMQAWRDIQAKGKVPPTCERWSDDDERELLAASKTEIAVIDTALGRAQARKEKELERAALTMADDKWEQMVAARRESHDSLLETTPNAGDDYELNSSLEGEVGVV